MLTFNLCLPYKIDIDVGSSTVARGVVNLVLGYLNNLVVEMAFLIQVKVINWCGFLRVLNKMCIGLTRPIPSSLA